jgi:hypothetical protein
MKYTEAEKIELYDAGVVLHPKDYSEGSAGWPYAFGESYCIDGRTIDKFVRLLGVKPTIVEKTDEDTGKVTRCVQNAPDLPIFRRPMDIGDGLSEGNEADIISKLWAKIEQPQLLHVRIRYLGGKGDDDQDYFDQDFTYSGAFNVWWVMLDREQIDEA